MKQKQYILPVQCVNCGTTFDLWHDLVARGETIENLEEDLGEREHFCWECRQFLQEEHQEDGRTDGLELELSWE